MYGAWRCAGKGLDARCACTCGVLCSLQNMAKATYGNEPAPIPCSAFNNDGNIYAYALSYDWSKGFQVRRCVCTMPFTPCLRQCAGNRSLDNDGQRCGHVLEPVCHRCACCVLTAELGL
jgi:hypothetical protein